jgi:hypothetical protein
VIAGAVETTPRWASLAVTQPLGKDALSWLLRPLRRERHSANITVAGKRDREAVKRMWTANDWASIWRTSSGGAARQTTRYPAAGP